MAVVVDVDGRLHAVDLGRTMGELGPFGKPGAIASCSATDALALAVDDEVILWRSGERSELAVGTRATALAFAKDGAALAVGTERGDVRIFSVADASPTWTSALRGPIADLRTIPSAVARRPERVRSYRGVGDALSGAFRRTRVRAGEVASHAFLRSAEQARLRHEGARWAEDEVGVQGAYAMLTSS